MRRWAPWGSEPIVSVHRNFRRLLAPSVRSIGGARLAMLALCGAAMAGGSGLALAQSDQQIRCMQLQQDLVAAQGGGSANRDDLARIDQQIAQADRVFQGTQAAMEDANCFQSFFIFGRGLNRTPQCLKMNDRVEDARRQLNQFQEQRQALSGGGGNRRRQAELQDAMARSGCGGQVRAPQKRGGGLLDFFGGGREDEQQQEELPQTPVYRSIDPNGRYRSVCVRLCDGFFYPISYSTYSSHLAQEADQCQSSCAAPAELYVYRNPGQEIEQAISLNGSAYMDLPVALRFRKEYVQGCSCKQVEYNPTEIEAANKRAEAEAASQPVKGKGKGKVAAKPPAPAAAPAPADQAAAPTAPTGDQPAPQLNLDVTGSNAPPSPAPEAELKVVPPAQTPPAPPAAAAPVPPPPAASASAAAPASGQPAASQSTVAKKTAKPAPTPPTQ
jgi:pyruvate/2-oxoglutarate dehydrogenase complex dihydrolipoamide acyltransferase (E2) component